MGCECANQSRGRVIKTRANQWICSRCKRCRADCVTTVRLVRTDALTGVSTEGNTAFMHHEILASELDPGEALEALLAGELLTAAAIYRLVP